MPIGEYTMKRWSIEEENFLIENYKIFTDKEIGQKLNCDPRRIRNKRNKLSLCKKQGRFGERSKNVNVDYFKNLNDNSCYIIGFIIADGHVTDYHDDTRYRMKFGLAKKDICILEFIRNEIAPRVKIKYYKNSVKLDISSKTLINDLYNIGVRHKKKNCSNVFDVIPKKYIGSLIRGFFDGDGSITWKHRKRGKYTNVEHKWNLCNQDLSFLNKIKDFIGFGSIIDQGNYYYLQNSKTKNTITLYEIMYGKKCVFSLDRKRNKFREFFNTKGIKYD
jgi:hypothetical protein